MKFILFSILGVILFVPILYVVPMQLNKKTKLLLMASSFLLAVLGSLAQQILTLWNTVLIILLLAMLGAYFISKREIRFAGIEVEQEEDDPIHTKSEAIYSEMAISGLGTVKEEPLLEEEKPSEEEELPLLPVENEKQPNMVPLKDSYILGEMDHLEEEGLPLVLPEIEHQPEPDPEMEPIFLAGDRAMEEMTGLIEEKDALSEDVQPLTELDTAYALEELALKEDDTLAEISSGEELLKERHFMFEQMDEEIPIDNVTEDELERVDDPAPSQLGEIPKEILYSLLEEIEWARQHMATPQFEEYLRQYLAPSLPDHQYYVFASLLRDFYLQTDQVEKCYDLLLGIHPRFSAYPILQQEIDYFLEKAIAKIDR